MLWRKKIKMDRSSVWVARQCLNEAIENLEALFEIEKQRYSQDPILSNKAQSLIARTEGKLEWIKKEMEKAE